MLFQAVESIVSLERGENAEIGISRADDLHVVTAGSKGGDNRSNISNLQKSKHVERVALQLSYLKCDGPDIVF